MGVLSIPGTGVARVVVDGVPPTGAAVIGAMAVGTAGIVMVGLSDEDVVDCGGLVGDGKKVGEGHDFGIDAAVLEQISLICSVVRPVTGTVVPVPSSAVS